MCHRKAFGRSDARGLFREVGYDGPARLFAMHCCLTGAKPAKLALGRQPQSFHCRYGGKNFQTPREYLEKNSKNNPSSAPRFHLCLFVRFGSLVLCQEIKCLFACESYL